MKSDALRNMPRVPLEMVDETGRARRLEGVFAKQDLRRDDVEQLEVPARFAQVHGQRERGLHLVDPLRAHVVVPNRRGTDGQRHGERGRSAKSAIASTRGNVRHHDRSHLLAGRAELTPWLAAGAFPPTTRRRARHR